MQVEIPGLPGKLGRLCQVDGVTSQFFTPKHARPAPSGCEEVAREVRAFVKDESQGKYWPNDAWDRAVAAIIARYVAEREKPLAVALIDLLFCCEHHGATDEHFQEACKRARTALADDERKKWREPVTNQKGARTKASEQLDMALDLIERSKKMLDQYAAWIRAGTVARFAGETKKQSQLNAAMKVLKAMEDHVIDSENPPDDEWFGDYFTLTGAHMILTDEGWIPGDMKGDYEADQIFAEVNANDP